MTSRQLRKQRREAERKARKGEYQQNRSGAAAAPAPDAWSGLLGCNDGFQAGVDEPAVLRLPKAQEVLAQGTACTEGALEAPVLQHLSEAKTQKEPERKARRLEYQQNRPRCRWGNRIEPSHSNPVPNCPRCDNNPERVFRPFLNPSGLPMNQKDRRSSVRIADNPRHDFLTSELLLQWKRRTWRNAPSISM